MPGAVSYNSVVTDLRIPHNTVREYLDFFIDLLIVGDAYHKADEAVTRRDKKIFLRDPFIGRSIAGWINIDYTEESVLELVMQKPLFRKFAKVYYFRNRSEIDVIFRRLQDRTQKRPDPQGLSERCEGAV
jgi:predicted AAA+ superfamily ATPase